MTTVTLQDVSAWTGRESVYLYLVGLTKATARNLAFWVFFPVLLLMAFIVAQAFPFRVLKVVRKINDVLPDVQNRDVLALVNDMYRLIRSAGEFYSRFCLFRETMREALEELDEAMDSLSFICEHKEELDQFLRTAEECRAPNLPLPFDKVAV